MGSLKERFRWITLVCLILKVHCVQGSSNNTSWSPNMELIEILSSPDNDTEQIRTVPKSKNSEIIVGEDVHPQSRLVIKCNATFPVQIVYIGVGRPEFSTFTNVLWREDSQKPLTFEAEATLGLLGFQGALRVEDTGNYTCRSIQNSTILSYYYVYVPGPSLFTTPDDYNSEVYFTSKDKQAVIPCISSHPKAVVTLYRAASGKLVCPSLGKNQASYDPRRGFVLNLKDQGLKHPEGKYICMGYQDESFRLMEYKLVSSNAGGNRSEGKHPCRPSPCGQKAECTVIDGHPVCFCMRGLSGNPYNECRQNKDRCHSNKECSAGQFCIQGKCTHDPCFPSPCGKGAVCSSDNGRPRCKCQHGYDGNPPYCLRKCTFSSDCSANEICSRNHCQDPCPNRCGANADCQVVTAGLNRTVLCTCPPGFTGDPELNCYDIGADPSEQQGPNRCPIGFIGPGPPNCRKTECKENYDCPVNHYCSAEKQCLQNTQDTCDNSCGVNAECSLSRTSNSGAAAAKPVCACRSGTTGNPFVRCYELPPSTTTTSRPRPPPPPPFDDPCSSNPCPRGSVCIPPKNRWEKVECICPPGRQGRPPNCFPESSIQSHTTQVPPTTNECVQDRDCPKNFNCLGGLCSPAENAIDPTPQQCRRRCGTHAQCLRGQCMCAPGTFGDPYIECKIESTPCNPSPCANFAECRVINGRAACRCILGYEGDAFNWCTPANRGNSDNEGSFSLTRDSDAVHPKSIPDLSVALYPVQHPRFPTSNPRRPTFLGNEKPPSRAFGNGDGRQNHDNSNDDDQSTVIQSSECDPRSSNSCGADRECLLHRDGVAKCVCASSRCGYLPYPSNNLPVGVKYGRYCTNDIDCEYPEEICSNATRTCFNPCDYEHSPCVHVAFSECRVVDGSPICTCRRGYVGNPHNGLDCRRDPTDQDSTGRGVRSGTLRENIPSAGCDYERGTGCDRRSECRLLDGEGQCVCRPGYIGYYPSCKLKCRFDRECFNAHQCYRNECVDPCERTSCGNNAFCRVEDHEARCECAPGFDGNPWISCHPNRERKRGRGRDLPFNCDDAKCSFF